MGYKPINIILKSACVLKTAPIKMGFERPNKNKTMAHTVLQNNEVCQIRPIIYILHERAVQKRKCREKTCSFVK